MSSIYNLEPQPTASVVIHTTLGEISVELFAKQTPLTCRNFLQLAWDGYYDGTIFHRLVPNFILQGGDPTGTGNGGESIYDGGAFSGDLDPWPMDQRHGKNAGPQGINFRNEFHSRLKFNRRGLLGMANEGKADTNGSQFFFTLDTAEELNGKNTMFGRVAGDTIYNLAKVGESEVDEASERPLYAVKIQRIEILVNPFEDMEKRSRVAPQAQSKAPTDKPKKKKRKGGKQLLSFRDEEGDDEAPILKKKKFDTRIVAPDDDEESAPRKKTPKKKTTAQTKAVVEEDINEPSSEGNNQDTAPLDIIEEQPPTKKSKRPRYDESSPEPESAPRNKTALEKANEEIAALKASMRRTVHAEQTKPEKKKSALEEMIPETSIRARKRRPGGQSASATEDAKALKMLKAFQSKLDDAPLERESDPSSTLEENKHAAGAANGGGGGGEEAELCDLHFIANCQSCNAWDKQTKEESDDEGWMSHALSFVADKLGKDLSNRKKGEDELVVIDPREKARTLKEVKKAERDARAGKSGRAWDQERDRARNAQMARAASLGGRGAR